MLTGKQVVIQQLSTPSQPRDDNVVRIIRVRIHN